MATITNLKKKNLPKDMSVREWLSNDNNIYIGTGCIVKGYRIKNSKFMNPFKVYYDGTRDEVMGKYREHILSELKNGRVYIEELRGLKGKNLGCFCEGIECHAEELLRMIDDIPLFDDVQKIE